MTTIGQLRREAAKRLKQAGFEASDTEARALVRFAFGLSTEEVVVRDRDVAPADGLSALAEILDRRLADEPLAYIVREREFWSRSFFVSPDTLIPRPETEHLVAATLRLAPTHEAFELLDLGTGSGCILLSIVAERPKARGTGLDAHDGALAVAARNAERFAVANQCHWISGDWRAARGQRFDFVVANPPYIPTADLSTLAREVQAFEPRLALDGGADGLSAYRQIAAVLPELLSNQGVVLLEGGAGQVPSIRHILRDAGLYPAVTLRDALGHERVVIAARTEARAGKISEMLLEYGGELAMFRAGN
jgi:release factor glutamine methyltransferase